MRCSKVFISRARISTSRGSRKCASSPRARFVDEAQAIVSRIDEQRIVTLPDALFGQLSNVVHGVGMLLLVEKLDTLLPGTRSRKPASCSTAQDAGNVGSILRRRPRPAFSRCSARRAR